MDGFLVGILKKLNWDGNQLHFALIKMELENLRLDMCFNDQYLTACVICLYSAYMITF